MNDAGSGAGLSVPARQKAALAAVLVLLAAAIGGILVANALRAPPGDAVGLEVGHSAPDFAIRDINGTLWRLADHRGRPVLLDFMGVFCQSCAEEMADGTLQTLHDRYGPDGFVILSVDVGGSLGTEDEVVAWRFMAGVDGGGGRRWAPANWTIALDNQGLASVYLPVYSLPMKYLLDGSGRIVWKHTGRVASASVLDPIIAGLI